MDGTIVGNLVAIALIVGMVCGVGGGLLLQISIFTKVSANWSKTAAFYYSNLGLAMFLKAIAIVLLFVSLVALIIVVVMAFLLLYQAIVGNPLNIAMTPR